MSKGFIPHNIRNPKDLFQWIARDIRLKSARKRLTNKNFTILCNNCLGAMVVHDYNQPHLSPTVNLYMPPTDYIRFLSSLEDNLKAEVKAVQTDKAFPVGEVNGSRVFFMHYSSFQEAKASWEKRAKRVRLDNLLVLFVERTGCTHEDLLAFDNLPFQNKIAIVHRQYEDIKSSLVIPGYEHEDMVGKITDWDGLFGKRKYDWLDWVSILNKMN